MFIVYTICNYTSYSATHRMVCYFLRISFDFIHTIPLGSIYAWQLHMVGYFIISWANFLAFDIEGF